MAVATNSKMPELRSGDRRVQSGMRRQPEELAGVVVTKTSESDRIETERIQLGHRIVDAKPERIVATEYDALGAEGLQGEAQHARRMGQRVDPHAMRVAAGRLGNGGVRRVGDVPALVEAWQDIREGATTVREAPANGRPAIEYAPEDHAGHGKRRLEREAGDLGQVVAAEARVTENGRLRVHEHRHVERRCRGPHRSQARVVEITA